MAPALAAGAPAAWARAPHAHLALRETHTHTVHAHTAHRQQTETASTVRAAQHTALPRTPPLGRIADGHALRCEPRCASTPARLLAARKRALDLLVLLLQADAALLRHGILVAVRGIVARKLLIAVYSVENDG